MFYQRLKGLSVILLLKSDTKKKIKKINFHILKNSLKI